MPPYKIKRSELDAAPIQNIDTPYADLTAMYADQAKQEKGYAQRVTGDDKLYYYLGTTVGDATDYIEVGGGGGTSTVSGLTNYALFVHNVDGDDATATLKSPDNAYKTLDAAIAAIPDDGNIWSVIIMNSATYEINAVIPKTRIRIEASGKPTITFANNVNTGYLNAGWASGDGYFMYLDFDLPQGTILFNAPGTAAKNSAELNAAYGFLRVKAKNVTVTDTFWVERVGATYLDIETLTVTGDFVGATWNSSDYKETYINIRSIVGTGNITPIPSVLGSPGDLKIILPSITTDGTVTINSAPFLPNSRRPVYNIGNVTASATTLSTWPGDEQIFNFVNSTLNGKIRFSGTSKVEGKLEIINNTQDGVFYYGQAKNITDCKITYNPGGTQALIDGYKTQDITIENCIIDIVTGYLSSRTNANWDYTGADYILRFKGYNVIIHHTDNGLLQKLTTAQTAGIKWSVKGEVKTNGLLQDGAGNITVHNLTPKRYTNTANVRIVSASRELTEDDNGWILLITASVTLTYPSGGLSEGWNCEIDVDATGDITIADAAATPGDDLDLPNGVTLAAGTMATLYRRPDNIKLRGKGEFA